MSDSGNTDILIDISTAIFAPMMSCNFAHWKMLAKAPAVWPVYVHRHRTMEISLRQWVREQVGVDLAHVEQLYTFADQGRYRSGESMSVMSYRSAIWHWRAPKMRAVARGTISTVIWEIGAPGGLMCSMLILPALDNWLGGMTMPLNVRLAFGRNEAQWDEEFVLTL